MNRTRQERKLLALCGWMPSLSGKGDEWLHPKTGEPHARREAVALVFEATKRVGEAIAEVFRRYEKAAVEELREDMEEWEGR